MQHFESNHFINFPFCFSRRATRRALTIIECISIRDSRAKIRRERAHLRISAAAPPGRSSSPEVLRRSAQARTIPPSLNSLAFSPPEISGCIDFSQDGIPCTRRIISTFLQFTNTFQGPCAKSTIEVEFYVNMYHLFALKQVRGLTSTSRSRMACSRDFIS